ncbi:NAD(P)/FAD-dependent oxidoreductase [Arthrobacter sp. 260]|uniref:dihydrolipoyl dehydrogenase family protein n=1 Tax=Arthrobacter sp. 260 TaxID=2735314 RepID=UPI00149120F9|nr:NAD(P)/FAD-dependent oxidoreductase [Arthrobacter sp. 260]NOJ61133.1 NAD(P)/FAD-dependent oxidoreductase [Arthrobacter sp. 260]
MARDTEVVDLLVIGGGTAGIVGSMTAASLGARTVLVERSRTGGDCLWTGCVPSKTILSAAAAAAGESALTGNRTDFALVRTRVAGAIAAIEPEDSPESLTAAGVTVISGSARFTGPGEADVDGRTIRFRQALIATGAAPALPSIPGLDQSPRVVTSETIWDLEILPGRLVIIGGGPVACELGQAFARLGSRVVILARTAILPKENRDAAALVCDALRSDGVQVIENTDVKQVTNDDGTVLHTGDGQRFDADVILAATGREARTRGLGLDLVGVSCNPSGRVLVDTSMRSSAPNIWAAGDVTAYPEFTHLAGVHASTAASNAVLGLRRKISPVMPRVTFTSPEVAAVGLTDATARNHTAVTIPHAHTDRAITEEQTSGFTRIIIGKGGRILGGTIVGPRAGESLAELTLAVDQGLSTRALAGVTHPYPTYNDALWNAAIAHTRSQLQSPAARTVVGALSGVNRWRTDRLQRRGAMG